ncbi:hypothetical protein TNCV_1195741 [Trichonephila clavipes]|nr:hypothetical protein TNCV_1195741 [Trichonephila clavipes]
MASRRVYYGENGNRAVARKFDMDETNIRRWRKQCDMISVCKSSTKSFTRPKGGLDGTIDIVWKNGDAGTCFEVSCDSGSDESFLEQGIDS